ncbi:hypothetical protein N2152v2_001181 [Parachlorella kessleri]
MTWEQLASEFSRVVIQAGVANPLANRKPTHLLPPTGVVAAQMDALQRNDWPETNAGINAAFAFTKPMDAEDFSPLAVPSHVRSWRAKEDYLTWDQFAAQLQSAPYAVLLDCQEWRPVSNLVFPSRRHENKAVLAIEVRSCPRQSKPPRQQQLAGPSAQALKEELRRRQQQQQQSQQESAARKYTFTFCLERVEKGPYKGCWMTVGVREGDYSQ